MLLFRLVTIYCLGPVSRLRFPVDGGTGAGFVGVTVLSEIDSVDKRKIAVILVFYRAY